MERDFELCPIRALQTHAFPHTIELIQFPPDLFNEFYFTVHEMVEAYNISFKVHVKTFFGRNHHTVSEKPVNYA